MWVDCLGSMWVDWFGLMWEGAPAVAIMGSEREELRFEGPSCRDSRFVDAWGSSLTRWLVVAWGALSGLVTPKGISEESELLGETSQGGSFSDGVKVTFERESTGVIEREASEGASEGESLRSVPLRARARSALSEREDVPVVARAGFWVQDFVEGEMDEAIDLAEESVSDKRINEWPWSWSA